MVLIITVAHDSGMLGFMLITLLLLAGPLALLFGADSRYDENARRRAGH